MHGVGGNIEDVAGGDGVPGSSLNRLASDLSGALGLPSTILPPTSTVPSPERISNRSACFSWISASPDSVAVGDKRGVEQALGSQVPVRIQLGEGQLVEVLLLRGTPEERLSGVGGRGVRGKREHTAGR